MTPSYGETEAPHPRCLHSAPRHPSLGPLGAGPCCGASGWRREWGLGARCARCQVTSLDEAGGVRTFPGRGTGTLLCSRGPVGLPGLTCSERVLGRRVGWGPGGRSAGHACAPQVGATPPAATAHGRLRPGGAVRRGRAHPAAGALLVSGPGEPAAQVPQPRVSHTHSKGPARSCP